MEAIVGHSNPAMTRHYTRTSEAAACAAVAGLPALSFVDGPDITGQAAAKPALPASPSAVIERAAVRDLVEQLTPKNANAIRSQLLELLASA